MSTPPPPPPHRHHTKITTHQRKRRKKNRPKPDKPLYGPMNEWRECEKIERQRFRLRLARQDQNENYKFWNLRAEWRSHTHFSLAKTIWMPSNDKLSFSLWNLLKRAQRACTTRIFGQKASINVWWTNANLIRIRQRLGATSIRLPFRPDFVATLFRSQGIGRNHNNAVMTRRILWKWQKVVQEKQCIL